MSRENRPLITEQELGESRERILLEGRQMFQLASENMAQQATRSIDILSYDLDKPLYNQNGFLEAVKKLAIHSRGVGIRILLQNSETVLSEGHRLIDLARRLTSKIEIKRPHTDYIDHPENFMIVDKIGYIRRRVSSRYEGEAYFCNPLQSKLLTDFFTEVWERSEPDSSLRRLYL